MYHQGFRCRVTNPTSNTALATPKPPAWCEGQPDKCTKGAKQMLYWHQADGNNIITEGLDLAGQPKSPAYNMKTGFADGRVLSLKMTAILQLTFCWNRCSK
jgi:hypothetical protein